MKKLDDLEVLALDCQATSSSPSKGHLLEIGWTTIRACLPKVEEVAEERMKSYLVRMPEGTSIPRYVSKVTGIQSKDMQDALSPEDIWAKLDTSTQELKSANKLPTCPTIIHFCRYEEPFLQNLYQFHGKTQGFPFEIICTHQISSRIFPGLPRKTLRAVAGYFGMSLPESRRSRFHVLATAFIWLQITKELKDRYQITTLNELQDWLSQSESQTRRKRTREYPMDKKDLAALRDGPGVYHMYRSSGDLLYVGKAKSIKKRVRSYFYTGSRHAEHTLEMLSQARHLSFETTQSALEAAILETDKIKQHSPPYNRALIAKNRKTVFFSKDLQKVRTRPDLSHDLGPIPAPEFLAPLAKLRDVLNGKTKRLSSKQIETILHIPLDYIPSISCFKEGLQVFRHEYLGEDNNLDMRTLLALGSLYWAEKLEEEKAAAEESQADPGSGSCEGDITLELTTESSVDDMSRNEWTPERVSKALKSVIRFGAFQIRRARWYCRLSEATLSWTLPDHSAGKKNIAIIESGECSFPDPIPLDAKVPFPGKHNRSLNERQAGFDIATYDRMRVVTTEIRRLLEEGRAVELCLHPDVLLTNASLKKMLTWL